ncbi:MAG: glycerol kinase GlpK [Thermomicrobiales bacterium]|nr:glycerol kinase GlpK [Thermomicrobiales bacterium]
MSDDHLILTLDQGTTSSRAILFDRDARVRAVAQRPITQLYPASGWVDHDATEIWETTRACMAEVLAAGGVSIERVAAIGITNQRETTIVWDRQTGEPLAPAIVWQSRQSVPWVTSIVERNMGERYHELTGLVPDAYFSASKLAMLLDEHPEIRRKADAGEALFGTVDSWLISKLTGGNAHITDVSNAARTMLFDIRTMRWADELLADLSIPRSMLPDVVDSSGLAASTDPNEFGAAIPIAGIAGDQHAALFGQLCFEPGDAKNTIGTGSFLLMNTGSRVPISDSGLLATVGWKRGDELCYASEGSVFVSGSAVQWLRDGLGLIESSADVERLLDTESDSGGVVFVPALVGLGAPHWDSTARGGIFGIDRGTTAGHLAHATIEGIALQAMELVDLMRVDTELPITTLKVDGGAAANDRLLQLHADLIGVQVVRPENLETTALGAAYLAGLAVGYWSDRDALRANARVDRIFEPSGDRTRIERLVERWKTAVDRVQDWPLEELGAGI